MGSEFIIRCVIIGIFIVIIIYQGIGVGRVGGRLVDCKVGVKGCGFVGRKFKAVGICGCLGVLDIVVYKFFIGFEVGLWYIVLWQIGRSFYGIELKYNGILWAQVKWCGVFVFVVGWFGDRYGFFNGKGIVVFFVWVF